MANGRTDNVTLGDINLNFEVWRFSQEVYKMKNNFLCSFTQLSMTPYDLCHMEFCTNKLVLKHTRSKGISSLLPVSIDCTASKQNSDLSPESQTCFVWHACKSGTRD